MREIRLSGSEGGETAIKAVFPTPIKRLGGGRLARFVVVAGRKTTCRKVFTPNTQLSLRYFPFPIKTGTSDLRGSANFSGVVRFFVLTARIFIANATSFNPAWPDARFIGRPICASATERPTIAESAVPNDRFPHFQNQARAACRTHLRPPRRGLEFERNRLAMTQNCRTGTLRANVIKAD